MDMGSTMGPGGQTTMDMSGTTMNMGGGGHHMMMVSLP